MAYKVFIQYILCACKDLLHFDNYALLTTSLFMYLSSKNVSLKSFFSCEYIWHT